jgi:hypothetical protein
MSLCKRRHDSRSGLSRPEGFAPIWASMAGLSTRAIQSIDGGGDIAACTKVCFGSPCMIERSTFAARIFSGGFETSPRN